MNTKNVIHQIETVEAEIACSEKELQEIDDKLFSETFKIMYKNKLTNLTSFFLKYQELFMMKNM